MSASTSTLFAHPGHEPHLPLQTELAAQGNPTHPEAEQHTATIGGLTGPTVTRGVSSIETLGVIDLGEEFPAMQGRQMRARVFTIEPGGVIALHAHEQRPGYALILSGSIVEHRNDRNGPVVRNKGDIAIEKSGVAHWWENVSGEVVRALVVDVVGVE
jgi:quercetin dioxygenase-like cupin family protein